MKAIRWIQGLFGVAAIYDGVLGVVFLVIPWLPFNMFQVTPPNHWAYAQFPAALLLIFALMFLAIARNPAGNRGLIPYGIGLKVAYCAIAFGYWATSGIPGMWKPFAIIDVVMAALFVWAYVALGAASRGSTET
jgi:hypothetical protein